MKESNAFVEKAKSDIEFRDKLSALSQKGSGVDEYIALAAEYGFTVTTEELEKIKNQKELSEEQLEQVAGGSELQSVSKCWFNPAGKEKRISTGTFIKCNSWFCYLAFTGERCCCFENAPCVDSWHRVDENDKTLYPEITGNHSRKRPPTYSDE